MNQRILFLNIGWMKDYRGLEDGDQIVGGGNYVRQNGLGHEIFNFQPIGSKMFGFVEPKTTSASAGRNSLHIEKIDKSYSNKDQIDGVLVVWTASRPNAKGNFIVGWYKNATIYRNEQFNIKREFKGEKYGYFITADEKDCTLLPEDFRTKEVYRATSKGEGWMGQSNIWYASHPDVTDYRQEVFEYINKNSSSKNNISKKLQPAPKIKNVPMNHSKIDLEVKKPSRAEVEHYLKKWNSLESYSLQESSLRELFTKTYPSNNNLDHVLIKVCALNQFYSTQIRKIFDLAKHIVRLEIDDDLKNNNLDLVEKIASGHKIHINRKAKESHLYSFATKYCSHHDSKNYPIYDSYVEKMLIYCEKNDKFDVFDYKDLKSYERFKEILFNFRSHYKLESFDLKQIDKYLWLAGKEYFPKNYGKQSQNSNQETI